MDELAEIQQHHPSILPLDEGVVLFDQAGSLRRLGVGHVRHHHRGENLVGDSPRLDAVDVIFPEGFLNGRSKAILLQLEHIMCLCHEHGHLGVRDTEGFLAGEQEAVGVKHLRVLLAVLVLFRIVASVDA